MLLQLTLIISSRIHTKITHTNIHIAFADVNDDATGSHFAVKNTSGSFSFSFNTNFIVMFILFSYSEHPWRYLFWSFSGSINSSETNFILLYSTLRIEQRSYKIPAPIDEHFECDYIKRKISNNMYKRNITIYAHAIIQIKNHKFKSEKEKKRYLQ